MDGFEDLRQKLDAIVEFISQKRLNPGFLEWELNALNSIYDNVVRYKKDLETSLSGSIFSKMKTPVCQISGIRKGVSDLGLLQRGRDDSLIDLIDQTDSLATSLCASFAKWE